MTTLERSKIPFVCIVWVPGYVPLGSLFLWINFKETTRLILDKCSPTTEGEGHVR